MLEPNTYYHIYNRANGNDLLFKNEENYRFFLKKVALYIQPIADIYCWCLMPNHFHFLIKIKTEDDLFSLPKFKIGVNEVDVSLTYTKFETSDKLSNGIPLDKLELKKYLSKQFSNLFSSYTQAFNKVNNRKGSLFIKNFKYKEVASNAYLSNLILYIHANPVHHGFVKQIQDWQFSSFHTFLSDKPTNLNRIDTLEIFNGIENFMVYHKGNYNKNLALIFED